MIIDSHAHVVLDPESYRIMATLTGGRNNPRSLAKLPPEEMIATAVNGLLAKMDEVGTDIQLLSPRPYLQMHSLNPPSVPMLWARYNNDLIHSHVQLHPDRFRGVAGLPQFRDASPANCIEELDRCIDELGFIGCLLNPDPTEGDALPPPGLGDEFWYPLYERVCHHDIPILIHSAGCCHPRESYTLKFINEGSIATMSLLNSKVFDDFPTLKVIVSHGGGAIPYQIGRFRAGSMRRKTDFDAKLKQLYFDTCIYSEEGLDLLFRICGPENCLFGTERPGTASVMNPAWGHQLDDLKPVIEKIAWLSEDDKANIFENNCRKLYTRAFPA